MLMRRRVPYFGLHVEESAWDQATLRALDILT